MPAVTVGTREKYINCIFDGQTDEAIITNVTDIDLVELEIEGCCFWNQTHLLVHRGVTYDTLEQLQAAGFDVLRQCKIVDPKLNADGTLAADSPVIMTVTQCGVYKGLNGNPFAVTHNLTTPGCDASHDTDIAVVNTWPPDNKVLKPEPWIEKDIPHEGTLEVDEPNQADVVFPATTGGLIGLFIKPLTKQLVDGESCGPSAAPIVGDFHVPNKDNVTQDDNIGGVTGEYKETIVTDVRNLVGFGGGNGAEKVGEMPSGEPTTNETKTGINRANGGVS